MAWVGLQCVIVVFPDILIYILLYIDNPYFEQMVSQIYPTELQLNKANSSDTEVPFLDLRLVQFQLKFMVNQTILLLKYTEQK